MKRRHSHKPVASSYDPFTMAFLSEQVDLEAKLGELFRDGRLVMSCASHRETFTAPDGKTGSAAATWHTLRPEGFC
jgi:hypothetical protein